MLIIFATIRYEVGWDYYSYYGTGKSISYGDYSRFGIFWQFLYDLATKFNSKIFVISIAAVLTNLVYYIGLKKVFHGNKNEISLALLTYTFHYAFYLSTFSTIRQGLSVAFMPLLIYYCKYKQYWKIVLILYAMVLAHSSAIIVALTWVPFSLHVKRINYKFMGALLIVLLCCLSLLPLLSGFLFDSSYNVYWEIKNSFGGKIIFVNILLLLYVLLRLKEVNSNKYCILEYFNIYAISITIGVILNLMMPNNIMGRVMRYSDVMLPIILFNMYSKDSKFYIFSQKISLAFLIILFFSYLYLISTTHSIHGACYVPYKTIFSK